MSDNPERAGAGASPGDAAEATGSPAGPAIPTGSEALRVGDRGPRQQSRPQNPLDAVLGVFAPNRVVSRRVMGLLVAVEAAIALGVWLASPFKVLPRPGEVLLAL